jgi:acetylxylan esterase
MKKKSNRSELSHRSIDAGPRHRRVVVISLVLAFFGSLAVAGPAQAIPSTNPCMITMIAVRGLNEAPGSASTEHSGRLYSQGGAGRLQGVVNLANADPDIPVYAKSLVYPATAFPQPGTPNTDYITSVSIGKQNLTNEIEYLVSACPNISILLVGYSQGAHVIGDTIGAGTSTLSANAKLHITGAALFADPSYKGGEPWNILTASNSSGIFARYPGAFSAYTYNSWPPQASQPVLAPSVRSWCRSGDSMCQSNFTAEGNAIHGSGYDTTFASGWVFMRDRLVDNN